MPLNRKHWHGWWAVRQRRSPAKTVGAEAPGEFDSRTIRQPICSDRPRDRAWNPAGRKRVGSAWRNAVGHTCPMRSRAFLLGVTAAHGSLEPLVLVRIQEEELGGSTSNRFSLYTRFDVCCAGHTGSGVTQAAKRRHALVAQWIERPPPERKATSPILVEGTHETPSTIMHGFSLLFSLTPSRLVRFVHHEATPL